MPDDLSTAIIIPAYIQSEESLHWLDLCLSSCEGSGADEVIVWDDGSTVDIRSITKRHPVVVGRGLHIGKSCARNNAVRQIQCNLLYPLDADDELMPNAITYLKQYWRGIPLYSDLYKVHGEAREYYELLPFNCDAIVEKSVSSVNVLHSKVQWQDIHGWNEHLNLFEDWEYNSRLFWAHCGQLVHTALVLYRQHGEQTTKISDNVVKGRAISAVRMYLKDFVDGRSELMGCCDKRKNGAAVQSLGGSMEMLQAQVGLNQPIKRLDLNVTTDLNPMGDPGPGNVWAKYVGAQGMGLHDRRGMKTRRTYQRVEYGGVFAVAAEDAVSEDAFNQGAANCGFILMKQQMLSSAPPPPPIPTVITQKFTPVIVERTPISSLPRTPVLDASVTNWAETLPSLSVHEVQKLMTTLSADDLSKILAAEKATERPRISIIKLIEKRMARYTGG